jgi:hypothetical protein
MFTYPFPIFLADVLPFYKLPLLAAPQLFTARNDGNYSDPEETYPTSTYYQIVIYKLVLQFKYIF